jgi:hypothetical protein
MTADYQYHPTGARRAPWLVTQSGPPPDAGPSPPVVAPAGPDRPRGMIRAAAVAYVVLLSATPADGGTPPIAATTPDLAAATAAARRAAAAAYALPLSTTPLDAGTATSAVAVAPSWPDRGSPPRRAAASAYDVLVAPAPGPWAYIQGAGAHGTAAEVSQAVSLAGAVAAGDVLAVVAAGAHAETMTVADSLGNTYAPLASLGGTTPTLYGWWCQSLAGGSGVTVTVTSSPGSGVMVAAVDQYRYLPGGPVVVAGTATAAGSGTAPAAGPIGFAGTTPALDWGAVATNAAAGTVTPAAGYTLRYSVALAAGVTYGLAVEDSLNDTSGSATPAFGYAAAANYAAVAAVFVPGPDATAPVACTDRAAGPRRAAPPAYAGLVSATPPDAGTAPARPVVAATWPDRAWGPARAAQPAYIALVSATPRDGGTAPIAAALPTQAAARPRAGWYQATFASPVDQGTAAARPVVAGAWPDLARRAAPAAQTAYVALVSATPRDGGIPPIAACLPIQAVARPRAAWYQAAAASPVDQGTTPPPPIPACLPIPAAGRPRPASYQTPGRSPVDQGTTPGRPPVACLRPVACPRHPARGVARPAVPPPPGSGGGGWAVGYYAAVEVLADSDIYDLANAAEVLADSDIYDLTNAAEVL